MDINDQVIKAIQAYADTLPNEDFRINLLAAAEDMAPKMVESLKLKQEWAILTMEKVQRLDDDGGRLPLYEELSDIRADCNDRGLVADLLNFAKTAWPDNEEDSDVRKCMGTRLYQDWYEEVQPTVEPELERLLDLPGT